MSIQSNEDQELVRLLAANPDLAIERIFHSYYKYVYSRIYRVLYDKQATEDVVQDIFLTFWRKREEIQIQSSLKAYLGKMALNRALNYIRDHKKYTFTDEEELLVIPGKESGVMERLHADDLRNRIHVTINALPPKCRLVFSLSRFEDMTYREIAGHLGISVKTVENQMIKALKVLRETVNQYRSE